MWYSYEFKPNLFYLTNPLVILSLVLGWIFLALLFNHPLYIVTIFIMVNLTIVGAGNGKRLLVQLRYALPFVLIIVLINALFNQNGSTLLLSYNLASFTFNIYWESIVYGGVAGLKLLAIITAFTFYAAVINPDEVLYLTRRLGQEISLIINLSFRLFPLIWSDYVRIREIQKHRKPIELDDGQISKIQNRVPTLSILLNNSLNRSLKTAESLYSRGYGSGKYSTYQQLEWRSSDYLLMANTIIMIALALGLQVKGLGIYSYYPSLDSFSLLNYRASLVLALLLSFPLLCNGSGILWHYLK